MTVLGAHVLAPDLAVAWADSEVFDIADRRIGFCNKVAVNPAGFAFVLGGWSLASSAGGTCAMDAEDLATALDRLPRVLRRASERAAVGSRRPELHAYTHGALIGWDAVAGAMVAYRFTAAECFVPMLDDAQTVPSLRVSTGTRPDGPHGVRSIAARQMLRLREVVPLAIGGPLHVAVIRPDGVTCHRVCNLVDELPEPVLAERVKEPA